MEQIYVGSDDYLFYYANLYQLLNDTPLSTLCQKMYQGTPLNVYWTICFIFNGMRDGVERVKDNWDVDRAIAGLGTHESTGTRSIIGTAYCKLII